MAPRYEIGQKVIITPVTNQYSSPRDSGLGAYAGKSGKVTNYHWISTGRDEIFYIYTVRIEAINKDIILHEDEIEAYTV